MPRLGTDAPIELARVRRIPHTESAKPLAALWSAMRDLRHFAAYYGLSEQDWQAANEEAQTGLAL